MSRVKLYGALVLVQVFFGIHYFAAKILVEIVEPRAWAAIRILGAGTLLCSWRVWPERRRRTRRSSTA
jgi:hypothetical protein